MKPLRNSVCKLSVTLWFTLLSLTTFPQKSPIGGRGAIIIGISHYQHLDSLQFAHRDAAAFAQFLKTQNVPDDNIKLFINQDATRFNIVDEIYNLTQKLQKGDKFFFYFTGHGDLEAKIGYENSLLLLHGCGAKNYFQGTEYLQLSELRTWFDQLTKKGVEVVFIADACHSGGLIGDKEGLDKTQRALQESWQGITKILSSQANEFSLEGKQWGGGRGIFSYFLVNGLTGLADANKDKKVSLKELDNYLKTNVVREVNPNAQTPVIQGNAFEVLSDVNPGEVARLTEVKTDYSKIIQAANLKSRESQLVNNLDTSLVNLYKRFSKAIEDNRIFFINDNEDNDCAMSNYEKLKKLNIPEQILQIMKRKLAVSILSDIVDKMATIASQGKAFPDIPGGYVRIIPKMLDNGLEILGQNHPSASDILSLKNTHKIMTRLGNPKYQTEVKKELLTMVFNDPKYPHYQVLLAHTYLRMNDLDSAILYFEKVKKLLPNQVYSEINIADAYRRNRQLEKAENYYQKAIDQDSSMAEAYHKLMTLYWQKKDYPKVLALGEKTISLTRNTDQTPMSMQWGNSMRRYTTLDLILKTHYQASNEIKVAETIRRYEKCAKEDYNKSYQDSYYWGITHLAHVLWDDSTNRWEKPIIATTDRMIAIVKANLAKSNNKESQVQDWRILGAYYHYIGQNKTAEKYFKDAVRVYEDESHSVGVRYLPKTRKLAAFWLDAVDSYLELCILAIEKKNLQEALQWLEKSMTKGCKRKDLYQGPYIIPELHGLAEYKALMTKYFPPTEKK